MAYEVTATRRRPKTFGELAGQEFVSATLSASIQSGQTAHAYLFSGPRGCGKTSAARILAKALNCEKGPAAEPCGECPSCSEISKGSGLDVIEIDGASNTSVNDVRQIKDEVLFPPNASRYKVYIIDEVHMLSTSAFNALLKTIEEPPPYIVFIFATTELHKVPATIKSRCQQFAFKLIPLETIQELLKDACAELNITAEDEALFWIARESTGSLRDAYTLFDQVASFSGGHIRTQLIHEKLGLVGLDNLNILAEACATGDTGAVFKTLDNIIESGVSIEQFTIDLAAYYRSMLLIKCGITKESLLGHSAGRFSQSVLAAYDESRLEEAVRIVLELFRNIRYSISPRFELESAAARLAALENWVSPRELSKTVEHVRAIIQGQWATPGENNTAVGIRQNASNESASNNNGASSDAPSSGTSAPRLSLTASFEQHLATGAPPPQVQSPPEEAAQKASADIPPEVELVRRMFDGEIISS
ncbi:MAG: DNA polymerase III subunit gamma/tau [Spirochaetaceae bacterium]|nr:DNA polymerase III subunit gamma/tau [Spirochaetaceae bacterium]